MFKTIENTAIQISHKIQSLHNRFTGRLFNTLSDNSSASLSCRKSEKVMMQRGSGVFILVLAVLFFVMAFFISGSSYAAIDSVNGLGTLAKTVKEEAQGSILTILLNAAGVACAAFAIITQRWTMLFLGIAYLVFVQVFFGFVNSKYGL